MPRRRALVPLAALALLVTGVVGAPDSSAEGAYPDVHLVSQREDGGYPHGDTVVADLTPDGRHALVATDATDLPRPDPDRYGTVSLLADLTTGSLTPVPADGDGGASRFTGDGHKILGGHRDGSYFLLDWRTGIEQRFTLPDRARLFGTSDDGQRLLYLADRPTEPGRTSPEDAWMLDLITGQTTLVGLGADGAAPADGLLTAYISGDGNTVAFTTSNIRYADGWSTTVPNAAFRRDLRTGVTTQLQVGKALGIGLLSRDGGVIVVREADGDVFTTVHTRSASYSTGSDVTGMTPDGRYLTYLAPIRPQRPALWRLDTRLGTRQLASLASANLPDEHAVTSGTISADGSTVVYQIGNEQTLDADGNHPRGVHVYVRRMSSTNEVRVCCPPPTGLVPLVTRHLLSADGNRLLFGTVARYDELRNPGYKTNVYLWTRPR